MASSVKAKGTMQKTLQELVGKLGNGAFVKVGFLKGATYPDGTPVATVAAAQEFGAVIDMPEREQTLYFKQYKNGDISNKFVKKSKSNYTEKVNVKAHQVVIPPRPFIRSAIEKNSNGWAKATQEALQSTEFNTEKALALVGQGVADQIVESIVEFNGIPLSPSTVKAKGFDKQLIDSGDMERAVNYEVVK